MASCASLDDRLAGSACHALLPRARGRDDPVAVFGKKHPHPSLDPCVDISGIDVQRVASTVRCLGRKNTKIKKMGGKNSNGSPLDYSGSAKVGEVGESWQVSPLVVAFLLHGSMPHLGVPYIVTFEEIGDIACIFFS